MSRNQKQWFMATAFLLAYTAVSEVAIAAENRETATSPAVSVEVPPRVKPANYPWQSNVPAHQEPTLEVENLSPQTLEENDPMAQVTSVSQLSDVDPSSWAFQALQSLVERYGCIEGYPDRTYRGNRAMTRYEFAAGLNACLNRINELIAAATTDLPRQEDLATIRRLQAEFATELTTLRGRVDALEVRTAEIEANQVSPTAKLSGVANFVVSDAFSGKGEDQAVFQQRVRLLFSASFSGKDLLITRLAAGNGNVPNLAGGTREVVQSTQWYGNFNNDFFLVTLYYLFPVTQNLTGIAAAAGGLHADYAPTINPYFEDYDAGTTSLSTFSIRNPIYRLGGGTGIGFLYKVNDALSLSAGYLAGESSNPSSGNGFLNGDYAALAQITWTPSKTFALGLTYNHAYFGKGSFAFGDNSGAFRVLGAYTGTGVVNDTLARFPTMTNSYGAEFSWTIVPKFAVGGWVGMTQARALGVGDGEIWTYALTLAFPDLGKKGNLGGLILGAQPYLARLENVSIGSNDTPWHVEGFYRYQVTDHISITPGLIWLLAPNQNADNEDIVIGTLRTTFTF